MKVTTKGQVTIPARIRKYLDIAPHSEVDFRIEDGTVVLVKHKPTTPVESKFATLRGTLRGTHNTSDWMQATRDT